MRRSSGAPTANFLDRWPTNLASVPAGVNPYRVGGVNPAGIKSLDCPTIGVGAETAGNFCPGEVSASSDLSHFAFSTEWNVFAAGGQPTAPGSVYDNDTRTREVVVVSKTPGGEAIPAEPGDNTGDPLQIPGLSSDGSHVLMGSPAVGPCGLVELPRPTVRRTLRRSNPLPDLSAAPVHARQRRGHLRRLAGACRHLRRYDGRRVKGLLHHPRPAHGRRSRCERRSLHVVRRRRSRRQSAHPGLEGQQPWQSGRTGEQRCLHRELQHSAGIDEQELRRDHVLRHVVLSADRRLGRELPLRHGDRLGKRRHLLLLA